MLRVEVFRAPSGDIVGFRARGHTGFDEYGRDIVCAGASAILHTAILGVVRHLNLPAQVRADRGFLELRLEPSAAGSSRQGPWRQGQAVLETAVLGLQEIERQYGDHVRVRVRAGGDEDEEPGDDPGAGSSGR